MSFRKELEVVINRHSMENGSDTPDFILAEYLGDCLSAYDRAVTRRERWYGRTAMPQPSSEAPKMVAEREVKVD